MYTKGVCEVKTSNIYKWLINYILGFPDLEVRKRTQVNGLQAKTKWGALLERKKKL